VKFLLKVLHPVGWEGRDEGSVGERKVGAQNLSSKIINKDLKGDKGARHNPDSCTERISRPWGQLGLSRPVKPIRAHSSGP